MDEENNHTIQEFHRLARKQSLLLRDRFQDAVKTLDRRKDENVYRQIQGKFVLLLRNKLAETAAQLLEKTQATSAQLNMNLAHLIDYYLNEFRQKTG